MLLSAESECQPSREQQQHQWEKAAELSRSKLIKGNRCVRSVYFVRLNLNACACVYDIDVNTSNAIQRKHSLIFETIVFFPHFAVMLIAFRKTTSSQNVIKEIVSDYSFRSASTWSGWQFPHTLPITPRSPRKENFLRCRFFFSILRQRCQRHKMFTLKLMFNA